MKKKLLIILSLLFALILISACGVNTIHKATSGENFKKYLSENTNFVIMDEDVKLFPEDASTGIENLNNDAVINGYTANKDGKDDRHTKITYFEMKTDDEAKALYNYLNTTDSSTGQVGNLDDSSNEKNEKNIIRTKSNSIAVIIVARINNTVIYASASKDNANEVEKIIEDLGY